MSNQFIYTRRAHRDDRVCPVCGKMIDAGAHFNRVYCSKKCQKEADRNRRTVSHKALRSSMGPPTCADCGCVIYKDPKKSGTQKKRCEPCALLKRRAEAQISNRTKNLRLHNLPVTKHDEILANQKGRCGICQSTKPGGKGSWHIDHDHRCCPGPYSCGNCIRGLLCSRCNVGMGMFKDDPIALLSAATYIVQYEADSKNITEIDLVEWMIRAA